MNKRNNAIKYGGAALILAPVGAMAQATPPVDLTAAGSDIASFIPTAAGWALPVFIGMVGLAIVLRAFRRTAK